MEQTLQDYLFCRQSSGKDIQWSDTGVASANKFLQKIWNLNYLILNRQDKKKDKLKEINLLQKLIIL